MCRSEAVSPKACLWTSVVVTLLSAHCSGGNPATLDAGPPGGVVDAGTEERGCARDADCPSSQPACDVRSGACVGCLANIDCPAGSVCLDHSCVAPTPCVSDHQCPGAVCGGALGRCVQCVNDADCGDAGRCAGGSCVGAGRACASSRDCTDAGMICDVEQAECVECGADRDCLDAARPVCSEVGTCKARLCEPGALRCVGATSFEACDARGRAWLLPVTCEARHTCASGACSAWTCEPGASRCDGAKRLTCAADGLSEAEANCQGTCRDGACREKACGPGLVECVGTTVVRRCDEWGTAWLDAVFCSERESCAGGACVAWNCEPGVLRCTDSNAVRCASDGLSEAAPTGAVVDRFTQWLAPRVDVLFAVDDGNQVAPNHAPNVPDGDGLRSAVVRLVEQLTASNADFRIAALRLGNDARYVPTFGARANRPRVVVPATDAAAAAWDNVEFAAENSFGDEVFNPVTLALSSPAVDDLARTGGFRRTDARLAVVGSTDGEGSNLPVSSFVSFIDGLGPAPMTAYYSFDCDARSSYAATRTGGLAFDTCATHNWTPGAEAVALELVRLREVFPLTVPAQPGSVVVRVDGSVAAAADVTLDATGRDVHLATPPEAGASIEIEYDPNCAP